MAQLTLDPESIREISETVAALLKPQLAEICSENDRWMNSAEAATYLGMTLQALYKLTARDDIPFTQSEPNAKCWFQKSRLDRWRDQDSHGPEI